MLGIPAKRAVLTGAAAILLLGALVLLGWQLATPPVGATSDSGGPTPFPDMLSDDPHALDRMFEEGVRNSIARIPADKKTWLDPDTVVYLLPADPHDLDGAEVAVAHHIP